MALFHPSYRSYFTPFIAGFWAGSGSWWYDFRRIICCALSIPTGLWDFFHQQCQYCQCKNKLYQYNGFNPLQTNMSQKWSTFPKTIMWAHILKQKTWEASHQWCINQFIHERVGHVVRPWYCKDLRTRLRIATIRPAATAGNETFDHSWGHCFERAMRAWCIIQNDHEAYWKFKKYTYLSMYRDEISIHYI